MQLIINDTKATAIKGAIKNQLATLEAQLKTIPVYNEFLLLKESLALFDRQVVDVANMPANQVVATFAIGNSYSRKSTFAEKAEYVLKEVGRPMNTTDIVNYIMQIEPALDRPSLMGSISSVLGSYAKAGKMFIKDKNEQGENIYSLKENKKASEISEA